MDQQAFAQLATLPVRKIYAIGSWSLQPYRSVIFTAEDVHYSEMKPADLIDGICLLHGASYRGREEATRRLSQDQYKKKVPVIIFEPSVAAFPTSSPQHSQCIWLFNHPMTFISMNSQRTKIVFPNGESVEAEASLAMLHKQRSRMFSVLGYPSLYT